LEKLRRVTANIWCLLKENMRKVRVLLGVLAVLVLVGATTGCGLVSDQTKQEAKKKVEAKAQQAKQAAKKKLEAKGQEVKKKVQVGTEDLKKKVDDLQKEVQAGKEDLK
jgi:Flp pilus assembly protein TadB